MIILILTRRPNERIIINDDVHITILEVRGNQVKIGITAPASMSVYREEIYNKINNLPKIDIADYKFDPRN